jgi:ABC-type lipoprotein release transport system permease subunit
MEIGVMESHTKRSSGGSAAIFMVGILIGGVGGGLAGWLLGGHIAPILSSVLNLITRDGNRDTLRHEAMQQ